jgi:phosphonate transport system substrate-binding protein
LRIAVKTNATIRDVRAITYLTPGIPLGFYEKIVRHLSRGIGEPVSLTADERFSGPPPDGPNPLANGRADIAFMCGPAYLDLEGEARLVPAAPVFDDPRAPGDPVYFAEVLTRVDARPHTLEELARGRIAFNDPMSLSGRWSITGRLGPGAHPGPVRWSGSHEASIAMVLAGEADVCAVDSVVWRRLTGERPELTHRLRVVESLGPFPIQPVVAAPTLPADMVENIADTLLELGPGELGAFGATGFVHVDDAHYRPLAHLLTRIDRDH